MDEATRRCKRRGCSPRSRRKARASTRSSARRGRCASAACTWSTGCAMVVDVVGTGGDHAQTINISTMAALVVAAGGIPVAKHGNRAASSACGSADVLEAAGFRSRSRPSVLRRCCATAASPSCSRRAIIRRCATSLPVRRELGVRTIFNLLGPLTNPARATHQVVGVAREELVEPIGRALQALGVRARRRASMAAAASTRSSATRRRWSTRSTKTRRACGD